MSGLKRIYWEQLTADGSDGRRVRGEVEDSGKLCVGNRRQRVYSALGDEAQCTGECDEEIPQGASAVATSLFAEIMPSEISTVKMQLQTTDLRCTRTLGRSFR